MEKLIHARVSVGGDWANVVVESTIDGGSGDAVTTTLTTEQAAMFHAELTQVVHEARRAKEGLWKVKVRDVMITMRRLLDDGDVNPEKWRVELDKLASVRAKHFTPASRPAAEVLKEISDAAAGKR